MRRFLFSLFFFGILCPLSAQNSYEETIKSNLEYLVKNPTLNNYFSIDESGLSMFASLSDKLNNRPEFRLYPGEYTAYAKLMDHLSDDDLVAYYKRKKERRLNLSYISRIPEARRPFTPAIQSRTPLKGLKVAIDPGHIAGNIEEAKMEWRYVKISQKDIEFYEAKLTFATARFLQDTLESLGATVMLTRNKHGYTAFGKTYSQWLDDDFREAVQQEQNKGRLSKATARFLLKKADTAYIFREFFVGLDLRERARRINEFRPHLTAIIHYDASSPANRDKSGHLIPTDFNYCLAFVPGAFAGDLSDVNSRAAFLRLMVSQEIPRSIELARFLVDEFWEVCKVPPYPTVEKLSYHSSICVETPYNGVMARNLALTKLVRGPLVYGESFYQDNIYESLRLAKEDSEIDGMKVPSRTREVAIAYFNAISRYVGLK